MAIRVKACQNGDDVFLLWKPSTTIHQCRGFAIERKKRGGPTEILPTWMGFEGTKWKKGTITKVDLTVSSRAGEITIK